MVLPARISSTGTYRCPVAFPAPERHRQHAQEIRTYARRRAGSPAGSNAATALEALGPVLVRAPVGDGARGLLTGRHLLGVLLSRPRPQPRLPLGRGRPARHLRRPVPPRVRARPVE